MKKFPANAERKPQIDTPKTKPSRPILEDRKLHQEIKLSVEENGKKREIVIKEKTKHTPEDGVIFSLQLTGTETPEQIAEMVKEALPSKFWWMVEFWKSKGNPLEAFEFTLNSGVKTTVYNWFKLLSTQELQELRDAIEIYGNIYKGKRLVGSLDYILISDEAYPAPLATGETACGQGAIFPLLGLMSGISGITLFPAAFEQKQHRAGNISNFKGTLYHELAHKFASSFSSAMLWTEEFGWSRFGLGATCNRPELCVTDYAKTNASDDICDSMVAVLSGNDKLDPGKKEFLETYVLRPGQDEVMAEKHLTGEKIEMPSMPNVLYYEVHEPIKLGRIVMLES